MIHQGVVILLGLVMIVFAFMALYTKNITSAVISSGVVSLFASILYLILQAPDVAMTEAAIGAGLLTAIFLFAINKTRKSEADND